MDNEIFSVSEGHLHGHFLSSDIFCNDFRLNLSLIILCTTIAKYKTYIDIIGLSYVANNTRTYIPYRCMKNWELFSAHAWPARMLYLHRKSVFVRIYEYCSILCICECPRKILLKISCIIYTNNTYTHKYSWITLVMA